MPAHQPLHSHKNSDSTLASWLAGTVVVLVIALVVGGYWMQQQRADLTVLRQQAEVLSNYQQYSREVTKSVVEMPPAFTEAQETRKYLLEHPAVTPGYGFDKPGVQSSGKTIVKAIDHAKGL